MTQPSPDQSSSLDLFESNTRNAIDAVITEIRDGTIQIEGLDVSKLEVLGIPVIDLYIGNNGEQVAVVGNLEKDMLYMASMIKPAYNWAVYTMFKDTEEGMGLDTVIRDIDDEMIETLLFSIEGETPEPIYKVLRTRFIEQSSKPDGIFDAAKYFKSNPITFEDIIIATCDVSSNFALGMIKEYTARRLAKANQVEYTAETASEFLSLTSNKIEEEIRAIAESEKIFVRGSADSVGENAHNTARFGDLVKLQSNIFRLIVQEGLTHGHDPVAFAIYRALSAGITEENAVLEGRTHEVKAMHPLKDIAKDTIQMLGKSGSNISYFEEGIMSRENGWDRAPESNVYGEDDARVLLSHSDSAQLTYLDNNDFPKIITALYGIEVPVGFAVLEGGNVEFVEDQIQKAIIARINPVIKDAIAEAA